MASPDFRWRAFFQRSSDPIFVLDRRRRLLYINPALESLSSLTLEEARGLACRLSKSSPATPTDEEDLGHALSPPKETLSGRSARVRRLLRNRGQWWDVEFLPLRADDEVFAWVGRVSPLPVEGEADTTPIALPEKIIRLREQTLQRFGSELLASQVPALERVRHRVAVAIDVTATVTILGERGTGKETTARVIHSQSPQRERSFARLDCDRVPARAIAELLLDTKMGFLRQGVHTVYLSEPGALPLDLQQRLVQWLGEHAPPSRPRVLVGSTEPLGVLVERGTLLEALACMLDTLVVELPALRDRLSDLSLLIERLWHPITRGESARPQIGSDVWEVLRGHSWPGNLSELLEVMASAWQTAKNRSDPKSPEHIEVGDLPRSLREAHVIRQEADAEPDQILPLDDLMKNAERRIIQLALRRANGNMTKASELLGIWRQRLIRRMKALDIEPGE